MQTFQTVLMKERKRAKREARASLKSKRGGIPQDKPDTKTLQKPSELRPVSPGSKKSSATSVASKTKKK